METDGDMEVLARNEDWLSPDGQEELRESEDQTWHQSQWCHGCPKVRAVRLNVGEGLVVTRKALSPDPGSDSAPLGILLATAFRTPAAAKTMLVHAINLLV